MNVQNLAELNELYAMLREIAKGDKRVTADIKWARKRLAMQHDMPLTDEDARHIRVAHDALFSIDRNDKSYLYAKEEEHEAPSRRTQKSVEWVP